MSDIIRSLLAEIVDASEKLGNLAESKDLNQTRHCENAIQDAVTAIQDQLPT